MEEKNIGRFLELVKSARKSLSAGDLAVARDFAELLLKEFPESEEGWLVLASISEPENALAYLEKALRVNLNSKAAHQAIRLITSQFLNGDQNVPKIPKFLALEDTQPIKVKDINANGDDSAARFDVLNELDSYAETQEISDLKVEQPKLENPEEVS